MNNIDAINEAAEKYAESVCNGEFPIEYTRQQVVNHTIGDFKAGYDYACQQFKADFGELEAEQQIKGNYLIAEFMGYRYDNIDMTDKAICLEYQSWDWLMPVVAKCLKINSWDMLVEKLIDCDIKGLWQKTVEFIKWYNSQKQTV